MTGITPATSAIQEVRELNRLWFVHLRIERAIHQDHVIHAGFVRYPYFSLWRALGRGRCEISMEFKANERCWRGSSVLVARALTPALSQRERVKQPVFNPS